MAIRDPMSVNLPEQLSVHETRQKKKADGGGLQQSSALEQRGGKNLVPFTAQISPNRRGSKM